MNAPIARSTHVVPYSITAAATTITGTSKSATALDTV